MPSWAHGHHFRLSTNYDKLSDTCKVSDVRCGEDIAGIAAALMAICIAGLCVDSLQAAVQVWMIALLASAAAMVMRKPVVEAKPALSTNDQPSARALSSGGQSR